MADHYVLLAKTIWPLIKPMFVKGEEEIGNKAANELFEVVKKYLIKDKQKALLKNLGQQPGSIEHQKDLTKELTYLLSTNNRFSRELDEVLKTLPPDGILLVNKLGIYRTLKHKIELCTIQWADTLSDTDEEYKNEIRILEGKFHTICGEIELICKRIYVAHE